MPSEHVDLNSMSWLWLIYLVAFNAVVYHVHHAAVLALAFAVAAANVYVSSKHQNLWAHREIIASTAFVTGLWTERDNYTICVQNHLDQYSMDSPGQSEFIHPHVGCQ